MDYLRRDSFFSGVTEGAIGSERIIKMLNVVNGDLVVEAKGIYSVEKFIIARRLMYWQVYLHKTVIAAEKLLTQLLLRARDLTQQKEEVWATPSLYFFLRKSIVKKDFEQSSDGKPSDALLNFANLDDNDIITSAKLWVNHSDPVLAMLAKMITSRKLFRVKLQNKPFAEQEVESRKQDLYSLYPTLRGMGKYFVLTDSVSNNAYRSTEESIKILYNNGILFDITEASDMLNTKILSKDVRKYFLCYPKEIEK